MKITQFIKNRCRIFLLRVKYRRMLFVKRRKYGNLVLFPSTPSFGNVGDHAILLAQRKIVNGAFGEGRIVEASSYDYPVLKKLFMKKMRRGDIVCIDGGGNFGDVWPETQRRMNDIAASFPEQKMIVFPESWYFTDTPEGRALLEETVLVFRAHKNVTFYARDSWSYGQMQAHFDRVKLAPDCVFCFEGDIPAAEEDKGILLCLRDDKEQVQCAVTERVLSEALSSRGLQHFTVKNDCYRRMDDRERIGYVKEILEKYRSCSAVVTDRFHGMVFSILCNKPCLVLDNRTGKVAHSCADLAGRVEGILCPKAEELTLDTVLAFVKSPPPLVKHREYDTFLDEFRSDIKSELMCHE